jgi:zinc transport system substrate-binding protein
MRSILRVSLAAALPLALVACGDDSDNRTGDAERLTVAAAFYPVETIVRSVGGDAIDVVTLVPPGEEAHEYEPTPHQLTELGEADVVVYLGQGFQPNVEKALESLPDSVIRLDLLDGLTLLPVTEQLPGTEGEAGGESLATGDDPHVWLDPSNMQAMTATVAAALADADPDGADGYDERAAEYDATLAALDQEFTDGLATCESDVLVTSHRAFGYLAAAYDLTQIAIAGISPTEEPSAKSLEAVATFAKDNGVTTIFFEENLPDDLAATVASEIGADTDVLDPVESLSSEQLDEGADYLSVMRQNLTALSAGLRCS